MVTLNALAGVHCLPSIIFTASMPHPEVSIILINFNSSHYTLPCVASIIKKTAVNPFEIIVIDNNSKEEDFKKLASLENSNPRIKVFRSRINLGFAGGNMLGVQMANPQSSYYFFLNNDCLLNNDVCALLSKHLQNHPQQGLCTGQIMDENGKPHTSFQYYPTLLLRLLGSGGARLFQPKQHPKRDNSYTTAMEVPVITGAAMFVRAAAFNTIGGLDTNYFLYCEEEDLCCRMLQAGHTAGLEPTASITHFMGKSTSRNWPIEREFYISLFYYFHKNYGRITVWLLALVYFFKNLRKSFRHRNYLKAALFILKGCPVRDSLRFSQTIS